MAKVTGPLMSMDASGKFGGAIVFSKWKGRNTVRQLVIPANPNSAGQETARNRMRVAGAIQNFFNLTTLKRSGETLTDKELIKSVTPGGYAWNGFLVDNIVGSGALSYTAAEAAYTALTAPQKAAWDDAAAALTPAITAVFQTAEGGTSTTPAAAGKVFFISQYALSSLGLASTPTGTPPTYA